MTSVCVVGKGAGPFRGYFELAGGMVCGGEDELGCRCAVRQRGLEARGDSEGSSDTGDYLEGYAGFAEGVDLLSGSAEDQRVAGLEAEDGAACSGVVEHEGVDLGLSDAGLSAALAYGDDLGGWAGEGQNLVGDEVVGEDYVGGLQEGYGAKGQVLRISWTCADQIDLSWLGFGVDQGAFSGLGLVRACCRANVRDGH